MSPRLLVPLLAAAALGCGDDAPTTPANTDDPSVPTLTVALTAGVIGTPSSNTPYPRGFTVAYSYNAQPGYRDLVVTLDGSPVAASGSFTMSGPRTLRVTATRATAAARPATR